MLLDNIIFQYLPLFVTPSINNRHVIMGCIKFQGFIQYLQPNIKSLVFPHFFKNSQIIFWNNGSSPIPFPNNFVHNIDGVTIKENTFFLNSKGWTHLMLNIFFPIVEAKFILIMNPSFIKVHLQPKGKGI